jgi:hypothetical protein
MSDATGHMDWPGAGPFSLQEYVDGLPVPYYTHEDSVTGHIQLIKINPSPTRDTLVKEFVDRASAHSWLEAELRSGHQP